MNQDDQNEPTVIEGEITAEETGEAPSNESSVATASAVPQGSAEDLITVTNLIQSYITNIEKAQQELSAHKQMLTDAFANDPTYRQHEDKVKEAAKVRNATKMQILKQPTLLTLAEKVKDMATSVKEMKESLSDYLQDYARMTGSREFEDGSGELRQIVYTAKLVKPESKKGR